jgi:PAS domain S-box-containing protein
MFLLDQEGTILEVNRETREAYGPNLIGSDVFALGPQKVSARRRAVFREVIQTGQSVRYEDIAGERHADVVVSPVWQEGVVKGAVVVARDITEKKRFELRMREKESALRASQSELATSEERLRIVSDTVPFPVGMSRIKDGEVLYSNKALADFVGMSVDELVGSTTPDLYADPEQRQMLLEGIKRDGAVENMEVVWKRGDGTLVTMLASVVALTLDGEPVLMGTGADISKLKRVESQLRTKEDLSRTLLHEMNHRVRNNLAAILSLLDIQSARAQTPASRMILDDLSHSIRAVAVVHDLLTENQWSPVPLKQLCSSVVEATCIGRGVGNDSFAFKDQTSTFLIPPQPMQHLALVVAELTTNALKHGQCKDKGKALFVTCEDRKQGPSIRFHNPGLGFPDAVLAGEREPGHVGLALVEGIVSHSLGGTLTLKNEEGAVVELHLPQECLVQKEPTAATPTSYG